MANYSYYSDANPKLEGATVGELMEKLCALKEPEARKIDELASAIAFRHERLKISE